MAGEVYDSWPAGANWVFQGTVAEDATGGTHICQLTVTPGVGSEFQVLYGNVVEGNTATSQTFLAFIDDGSNALAYFYGGVSDTTANIFHSFPSNHSPTTNINDTLNAQAPQCIVSGAQRVILRVSTTAISVTQTFSLVCRIKGAVPTAVLSDSVGTPVLTVNTNKVF